MARKFYKSSSYLAEGKIINNMPYLCCFKKITRYSILGLITAILINIVAIASTSGQQQEFLGQGLLRTGFTFQNTEVGGLSGITYDPEKQVYYAISDDRSSKAPARFYTLKINLSKSSFSEENITFLDVTTLLDENEKPFPEFSLDPEGIALRGNALFIASEGDVSRQIPPFIKEFSLDGKYLRSFPIPEKILAKPNGGIRNNLAFESLTLTPDKKSLFAATENALIQDGEKATLTTGSPIRILRYDLNDYQPQEEYLYLSEPIAAAPTSEGGLMTNGLVELLALGDRHLLSLERSFSLGPGNFIKLFEVSLEGATDIKDIDSLKEEMPEISPVQKTLLLDLNNLGFALDNIEGMTLGPILDGRPSLVLVGDNNFNFFQVTQFLVFRL
ncbi:MAG: esterase-like activity of phytase family protein [Cyanobacteriota bacterium]|nr:esterase-like activity of phytase family protein [Cyanobacteriota bacterium]